MIDILTDAVKAYQAADVMETQGDIYLKNLNMLSDTLHDLKDQHDGRISYSRSSSKSGAKITIVKHSVRTSDLAK